MTDLRVVKTNTNIEIQFIKLLQTNTFQDVTIKMLISECQINRSTFYRHYEDKYDLLDHITKKLLNEFQKSINTDFIKINNKQINISTRYFNPMIDFFEKNKDTLIVLNNCQLPINLADNMLNIFTEIISQRILQLFPYNNIDEHIAKLFSFMIASNILTSIKWWHFENTILSKDDFLSIVYTTVNDGISKSLNKQICNKSVI